MRLPRKTPSSKRILSVLIAVWTFVPSVHAQSVWNAATGDWATPGNWTPAGAPNGVTATINNAGTATVSTVVAELPAAINVGSGPAAGNSGRLDIVAGSLSTAPAGTETGTVTIGTGVGSGVLNIANTAAVGTGISGFGQGSGSFTVAGTFGVGGTLLTPTTPVPGVGILRLHTTGTLASGDTLIGVGPGGDGKIFMESGTWNSTGAAGFGVGVAGGLGLMNMSGGNLSVSLALAIGYVNGDGTFNLADTGGTGGALTGFAAGTGSITAGSIHLGDSGLAGKGTLRINTTGSITSGDVRIGETGTGIVLMDAGVWNAGNTRIGTNAGGIGTFTMGGGSFISSDEIRVATDGGTGTLNQSGGSITVPRFNVGTGSGAATVNLTGTGTMLYEEMRVGLGGTGAVNMTIANGYVMQGKVGIGDSPNQHWGTFNAGENSTGTVAINQTGGTVAFSGWMTLGNGSGPADPSLQTYTISGGLIKDNRDQPDPRPLPFPDPPLPDRRFAAIEVGSDHGFTMNVLPGATINVQDITTGHRSGGNGIYNQSGGQVTANGWMWAGREGRGTVNVTGGNLDVLGRMYVGDFNVAVGEMNVNYPVGSTDRVAIGELRVGANAGTSGVVNVLGGLLKLNGWGEIGQGGGTGTVNVNGPTAILDASTTANQDFQIGLNGGGNGSLNIRNGGQMTHNWWINIARGANSTGQLTVDGVGSKLTHTNGRINVGEQGTGTLTVSNGGIVDQTPRPAVGADTEFVVGRDGGGIGVVNLSGVDSRINVIGDFRVGSNGGATGTVNVNGGTLNLKGWVEIGSRGGVGVMNADGPTAIIDASATTDGAGNPRDMLVGLDGGNGTINVRNGGQMTHNWWLNVGRGGGSTGQVTVDGVGSKYTNTNGIVNIGEQSVGTLTVSNGGVFEMAPRPAGSSQDFIVGRAAGSTGVVNLSGADSRITTAGWAYIGLENGSNGSVNMQSGTFNAADWLVVGNDAGSTGQFNMTDGTVNVATNFLMGRFGRGTFTQLGGTVNVNNWVLIGADPSGRGEYNLAGGVLNQVAADSLVVGRLTNQNDPGNLPSRLTISGTGELRRLGAGDGMYIGDDRHGNGILEVLNGGKITSDREVRIGSGRGDPNDAGEGGGAGIGLFNVDNGSVTINHSLHIGRGRGADPVANPNGPPNFFPGPSYAAEGTMNMLNGDVTVKNFFVGSLGAKGTLNMSGGLLTSTGDIVVAADGVGSVGAVTHTGGTMHANSNVFIARNGDALATYDLSAGGILEAAAGLTLAHNGTSKATMNVSGSGSVLVGTDMAMATSPGSTAILNVSGGSVSAGGNFIIGAAGTATLTQTGGTISAQNVFIGDGVANTPMVTVPGIHTGSPDAPGFFNARTALTVRGGTLDVNGPIGIEAASTLEVTGPTVLVNVPGPVGTATGGVIRATTDALIVDGTLTVNSGLGVVRAGLSGTVVGGNGIINADLNLINGARLAPGTSPGNLTITGDLVFDSSAIYSVEIEGGTLYDSVTVSGAVTLAGAQLSGFTPTPLTISSGEVFYIIRNLGVGAIDGIFSGAADGSTVALGGWTFQISYDANFETSAFDTGGNDVALKAIIPEPASLILLGSSAMLMLARRRRREV